MKFKISNKGFSLVELMVVVAIIGILTAIAVPRFQTFRARAIRAEANAALTNINTLQHLNYTDADAYDSNLAAIGFQTDGNSKYAYTASATTAQADYTARAVADDGAGNSIRICPATNAADNLTVTSNGTIVVGTDGLAGC